MMHRYSAKSPPDDFKILNNEVCQLYRLYKAIVIDTIQNQSFESTVAEAMQAEQVQWLLENAYELFYDYFRDPKTYGTTVVICGYLSPKNLTYYQLKYNITQG